MAAIFPEFQFGWLAEETRKNIPLELDFVHEGKNCEQVSKMFRHLSFLKVTNFVVNIVLKYRSNLYSVHRCVGDSLGYITTEFYHAWLKFDIYCQSKNGLIFLLAHIVYLFNPDYLVYIKCYYAFVGSEGW